MAVAVVALAASSCSEQNFSDDKYQSKLVGTWSLESIKYDVKAGGTTVNSTISIPGPETELKELIYTFYPEGSCSCSITYTDDTTVVNEESYEVRDGDLCMQVLGDDGTSTEVVELEIKRVTNKELVLEMESDEDMDGVLISSDVKLYFRKK
ncbi:MAG: hypothetical protein IJ348_04730 [Alistipes sp.]|nr:hypothetical protein [Alistipes sp.]